jgi:hypothetical protein
VERIVTERKRGVGGGAGKGGVRNGEETSFERSVAEVADGVKRRERRDQGEVGRRGVGREALTQAHAGTVFLRPPGGESAGEEGVQWWREGLDGGRSNKKLVGKERVVRGMDTGHAAEMAMDKV